MTFERMQEIWSRVPVEGKRYPPVEELLSVSDEELRRIAAEAWQQRYKTNGWRNAGNQWREGLGLDSTSGSRVLDFGCGAGIEAMEYAKTGNQVTVADIVPKNISLAQRMFRVHDLPAPETMLISSRWPFVRYRAFDVIHCSGVLHHIPWADQVLRRFADLAPEVRLMLYSDIGWRNVTGTEPPEDTQGHPKYEEFVRFYDRINVGGYADWYDREKLQRVAEPLWRLADFRYITQTNSYCTARLERT